jgi:hypothetical protein
MTAVSIKLSTMLGILEPMFYFMLITALSLTRDNYSLTKNYISELSGADSPHRKRTNMASFVLLGAIVIIYSFALRQATAKHKLDSIAQASMIISGASLVLLGLVPADGKKITATGKWHRRLTGPPAIGIPLAIACHYFIFKKDRRWRKGWPELTLLTSALMAIGDALLYFRKPKRFIGMVQRINMGMGLLWVFATSNKAFKLHTQH